MKKLTVTFHMGRSDENIAESCFDITVSDRNADILLDRFSEDTAEMESVKSLLINITSQTAILQSGDSMVLAEIVDVREAN